ncbi:unnamed protein product [Urochloa decumbens]|uniref:Rx N-terminal domain-containing protein n=1 Tax=Urochloa decumbens TaxID=240449 RepID=A0ABC9AUB2_9POAL
MASFALAAVRPLLGLILSETQLLRGVRSDVQFISDEMDSIKGFLMKLAGTKEGAGDDHQVRAWMAQVMEVAYVSTNCIQDYALCGQARHSDRRGLVGHLQRAARFPKCILARYRVATRIRRLKIRVLEVSARQQRYAVVVPPRKDATTGLAVMQAVAGRTGGRDQEWLSHPDTDGPRRAPMLAGPDMLTEGTEELTRWLKEPPGAEGQKWPHVLAIISPDGIKEDGTALPDQLYNKFSSQFELTARVSIQCPARPSDVLLDMRRQLIPEDVCTSMENGRAGIPQLWPRPVPPRFKGKRLLVVLSGMEYPDDWWGIKMALDTLECSAGSAIVLCTKVKEVAEQCSPTRVLSLVDFYAKKILSLDLANINNLEDKARRHAIESILNRCNPNIHCMNLFLQTLYRNPYRTELELKNLYESLDPQRRSKIEIRSQMMKFCFHGLPQAYKNCLWYSAIFTRGSYKTRRSSLVRRWVAEALIDKAGRYSAIDEAEHCFDVLSAQKLLLPCDVDGAGKIKSCAVDPLVIAILKETIRVEDFLDPNLLPPELSLHFSIRNGILLRQFNSIVSKQENTTVDRQMKSIMKFLKLMTSSSSFRHLQVLELEGYKGFKKRHLRNICKIHQLRYLNLRNTDISQLPTEMDQLLHLETLDIRGTRVQAFNTVLPMLKHLLAGHIHFGTQADSIVKCMEFFSTMRMPRDVTRMENLEILSHVKVSNSAKQLTDVSEKLKLKKLGVVLHGKNAKLNDLFIEIDKLNRFLVSLSIRVEVPVHWDVINDIDLTPPKLLESLRICGIRGLLPGWINQLQQLSKITLRDTFLNEDALAILGTLRSLSCLRLGHQAFDAAALTINGGQFSNLIDLVIEDAKLTRITFGSVTAPKLGKMVWSFSRMDSLSGVLNLLNLRSLELNGGRCVPDGLRDLERDITAHHNRVSFKFNPPKDDHRSGNASAATATS